VLDIYRHIEIISKSVFNTFCSGVQIYLEYFTFSNSGNIIKRDLFCTNIRRFSISYISIYYYILLGEVLLKIFYSF